MALEHTTYNNPLFLRQALAYQAPAQTPKLLRRPRQNRNPKRLAFNNNTQSLASLASAHLWTPAPPAGVNFKHGRHKL